MLRHGVFPFPGVLGHVTSWGNPFSRVLGNIPSFFIIVMIRVL